MEYVLRISEDGYWEINGYSIGGNEDDGYVVLDEDNEDVYSSMSFEKCIVWCIRS